MDEGSTPEMCDLFRSAYPTHSAQVWIYGDATGQARSSQSRKSNYDLILNKMLSYPTPVITKVPVANPPVATRINSVNNAFRTEIGETKCEIDPTCIGHSLQAHHITMATHQVDKDWVEVIYPRKKRKPGKFCKFCNEHIGNMAHRRIGVCANCMSESRYPIARIPTVRYNGNIRS